MWKLKPNSYGFWLLLVIIAVFFFNLDVIYVNIMEARNFITAREMVNQNHWLLTTMNNLPRYEKPPLPTWLTAISGVLFGFKSLVAMRLPAVLSTALLIFTFYKFVPKIEVSKKQAFISSLVLATSFYIIFSGRNGQWDIFTHAFMMVSIYFLWNLFRNEQKNWQNALLAGVFFGFSFMSKGPVSLYALWLPFMISFGIVYRFKNFGKKWLPVLVFLIVGLAIGLWWFVYVRLVDPNAFLEIAHQESSRWANYNVRPFYYYWSFFTQTGIWTIPSLVALFYWYLKDKVSNRKAYNFSILWTVLAVVLLSVIPEKKSRYLLPVLIPMALNTGFYIEYLFRRFNGMPAKEKWVVYFNHGLIALIGIGFPVAGYFLLDLDGYWGWYILSSIVLFTLGIFMLIYLKKQNYARVFYLTIAFSCGIITCGFPLANAFLDNPDFHNIAVLHDLAKKENLPVYEYAAETPELIWEYGEPIPKIHEGNSQMPKADKFGILVQEKDSIFVQQLKNYRILATDRYDLNYVNPKKSGYKDRLIRRFYVVERK